MDWLLCALVLSIPVHALSANMSSYFSIFFHFLCTAYVYELSVPVLPVLCNVYALSVSLYFGVCVLSVPMYSPSLCNVNCPYLCTVLVCLSTVLSVSLYCPILRIVHMCIVHLCIVHVCALSLVELLVSTYCPCNLFACVHVGISRFCELSLSV